MNPIDWLVWLYGKWFTSHPVAGYFTLLACAGLVLAVLWLRAIDKYHEQHPPIAGADNSKPTIAKPQTPPRPTRESPSKEFDPKAQRATPAQESKKDTSKLENKKGETSNGATDRSVKIGPNSNVTNSPIVTGDGNVVLSGPEARIQSLDFRIAVDVPTVTMPANKPGDPDMSVGIQSIIGLFDLQKARYRFATNFQFTDFQTTETTHRYGFSYTPEDGNDLVGRPIAVLAQIDKLAFNFSEFLKTVAANKIVTDRPTQLSLTMSLNSVAVMNTSMSIRTELLVNGQITTDVGGVFSQIESIYKEALKQKARP